MKQKKKKKKESNQRNKINDKLLKDTTIRDIRAPFELEEEYYTPKRVGNFWNDNYIQYESNSGKKRKLTLD